MFLSQSSYEADLVTTLDISASFLAVSWPCSGWVSKVLTELWQCKSWFRYDRIRTTSKNTFSNLSQAIWPSFASYDFGGAHNTLPKSGGISTAGMIAYFMFWIIQLPLLLIPPTRLRYLFMVKLIAAPITAIATMAYLVHKAGGSGALFDLPGTVTGDTRSYLWLSCMSSVTGSWATLACNIPDFSRYAKERADGKPNRTQYIQLPFLPIIFTICGVLGIITTSASKVVYGEYYWNPLDIVAEWLANGHGGRAAAFFAALSWYIAQVRPCNIVKRS